ncbi:DnaD domain-containing protein [Anaerococcus sp. Marseille-Q5996]|uniref:DnaD domain-containing protein n=1 Tax=Anaerococcus sp. Marseille-Q5996 TaxID=2972769 RepID=UPI0021CA7F2F|nr:DnaD domain protein [Anaerococcus sp. Marseille-Q5996]
MNFKMQDVKLDLGTTAFENMFLNTYVQMADGDSLKVFLLVYKDIYNTGIVDSKKIQKQLSFTEEKFNECIEFWVNMGVFREKKDSTGQKYIEIISLRQMYYGDNSKSDNEISYDIAGRKSIMFDNIERIIDRNLTTADITRIQETLADYKADPELVTEAFRQGKVNGNMDVKYVLGYIKTWRDQGIFTLDDLKMREERQKLARKNSPRQYRKKTSTNDHAKDYAKKAREERFKKMLGEDLNGN